MELDDALKSKVAAYQPSQAQLDEIREAPLLFTVGITGAGKNALLDRLLQKYPNEYQFIISHTTRPMRDYEKKDVHYHFTDFQTAERMVDNGEFIEVQVVHFENLYGTSISEIRGAYQAHKIACTDIDIQGVDDYLALGLNVKAVFLLPGTYEIWKRRLLARYEEAGDIDHNDLKNRYRSALIEIQHALDNDHFYIVINEDLEETSELVNEIAHGDNVPPHYPKAVAIAEEIAAKIRAELAEL
jgi:guanylate kinase